MIQKLEQMVREGQFQQAQALLRDLKWSEIERRDRLALAGMAGRVGQSHLALRILNPIIRDETTYPPASWEERLQYANLLRKLGAVDEAMDIIQGIDPRHAEARLNLAFCLQTQWRYREAATVIEEVLERGGLEPYRTIVARVNLLAAYIFEEDMERATVLADQLRFELDPGKAKLLLGNVLEMSAQIEIRMGAYGTALAHLTHARTILSHAEGSASATYIDKWVAVADSLAAGSQTPGLAEVRSRAEKLGHWEIVRDCDYYLALVARDETSFARLYFGTPFSSFREKIVRTGATIPDHWLLGANDGESSTFDLERSVSDDGLFVMSPGQSSHRLLIVLCQDFYRPVPLLTLFARLFPKEHFSPGTSPNRVHQILKRFRKDWPDFAVEEIGGGYKLRSKPNVRIRIPRDPMPLHPRELELVKLRASLTASPFSTHDAAAVLSVSRSAAQRLLSWASRDGRVIPNGRGARVRYRLAG